MSGIAAVVGKTLLKETATNHFGKEDPYFEKVPATRLERAFGKKTKKRRKAIPPGVSEHDGKVLTKVKRRAYRLDYSLCNFCGVRFGWSSLIAIIPVVGDAVDLLLALMVMRTCGEIEGGMPGSLKVKMLLNVIVDFFIGLVPFVGDIADALYKCNSRNAILLEQHLRKQHEKRVQRGQQESPDPTLPDEFDRYDENIRNGSPPRRPRTRDRPETRDRRERRDVSRTRGSSRPPPESRDRHDVSRSRGSSRPPPESIEGRGWTGGRRQRDLEQGVVTREY